MKDINKREKQKQWEKKYKNTKIQKYKYVYVLYRIFLETLTKGELFQAYTNSITSLGKVLEKPKCPISIQWKIPLYF